MSEEVSPQRQLVLEQKYRMFENSVQVGEHLDSKASALLQAGGLVIALTGVVKIPGFVANPDLWSTIGIAIAFFAFAGMVLLAVFAGLPSDFGHSGNTNWDEMFADYIHQDVDACFDQILADLLEAIERSVQRNRSKARYVTWAAVLFAVQILGVLFLALVA